MQVQEIGQEETPLSLLGWQHPFGPVALLERVAEDKATIEWRGRRSHQNQSLAVVGFKSGFWGKKEFLFDPSRGYLPARIDEQTHGWPEKKPHSPHQTHL